MASSNLFKPLQIGNLTISHRIGMCPLTRLRATDDSVPNSLMAEYYAQRASTPGTLIISEGTFVSAKGRGAWTQAPGIWSREQILGWRSITDAVHARGCFIVCQLFAMARAAGGEDSVGPSAIPIGEGDPVPREMSIIETETLIQEFAQAAKNAIAAGFDLVECHAANGCLIDQFIQDTSNKRTDDWGGSVENRSRFVGRVLRAMVDAVGAARVGMRLSPWSTFQGMRMADPIPQFTRVIELAAELDLAYLHLVESRISGAMDSGGAERLDFAHELWRGRPLLLAGGFSLDEAQRLVDEERPSENVVVMFGRLFLANPDLVHRFKNGLALNKPNRDTFYSAGAEGYVDYPMSMA